MAQAEPRSTTRRALMGAIVAAAFVGPALAVSASPLDADFRIWWEEMDALEQAIEDAPLDTDEDQDVIDQMVDRAGVLQDMILYTPGRSRVAVEAKLRTLIRYFGNTDAVVVAPAKEILAFVLASA